MDAKLRRKIIVSAVGIVAAIGVLVGAYLFALKPYVKSWQAAREEIRTREKKLADLRKAFADQLNPEDEMKVLREEIDGLTKANQALKKLQTAGVEPKSLPAELSDPDPQIKIEMYKDYMKQIMDAAKEKIKEKLKTAQISPPDLQLYSELKKADELSYYLNRAAGLQGIVDALSKSRSSDGVLVFDKLTLEDFGAGSKRREGAITILSYQLKLTMDTQSLMSFLYNLRDEPSYYYIEELDITPRSGGPSKKQQLSVDTRVDTTMIFKSQVEAQVKEAAAAASQSVGAPPGGLFGWAVQMKQQMEEDKKTGVQKKWYQFWKK